MREEPAPYVHSLPVGLLNRVRAEFTQLTLSKSCGQAFNDILRNFPFEPEST
jgi:hypothetical protein